MKRPIVSATIDDDARTRTKRWAADWKAAAPILEAERWDRLAGMTGQQRARMTLDLLSLWRPDLSGDNGEGLIRVQRAFARWRKRRT
jgi:hypothetical protein